MSWAGRKEKTAFTPPDFFQVILVIVCCCSPTGIDFIVTHTLTYYNKSNATHNNPKNKR